MTGIGVGQAFHAAGRGGLDGIVRLTPDGKLHIHCGVGNLGTFSYAATSRVAAEVLKVSWDNCIIERGDSRLGLPFSSPQSGSNTSFTMTRATYAGAMDALAKLKEIAAATLGGAADDYDVADETVFAKADRTQQHDVCRGRAARHRARRPLQRAKKCPRTSTPSRSPASRRSRASGLIGVAKDNIAVTGMVPAIAIGFVEIELDKETGKIDIVDYLGVADCGTVLHPMGLNAQIRSGAVMGFGMGLSERHIYDPQNGLPGNVGLISGEAAVVSRRAVAHADARRRHSGSAEPRRLEGHRRARAKAARRRPCCAAIADALGGHYFNRAPVLPDMIVNAAAGREQSHKPLQVSTA